MSRELDTSAAQMLRHGRNVLSTLCLMVELVFGRVMPTLALEQVLLQLKWKSSVPVRRLLRCGREGILSR